jgi:hypothetical protein
MTQPLPSERTPGPDHAAPAYDVVGPDAVEPKTKAAALGGGAGGVVAGATLWGLDALFWNGEGPPGVPGPIEALVWVAVPAGVAFVSSYFARHVNRTR